MDDRDRDRDDRDVRQSSCSAGQQQLVKVLYVQRKNAKTIKNYLEKCQLLHPFYRMTPYNNNNNNNNNNNVATSTTTTAVAITNDTTGTSCTSDGEHNDNGTSNNDNADKQSSIILTTTTVPSDDGDEIIENDRHNTSKTQQQHQEELLEQCIAIPIVDEYDDDDNGNTTRHDDWKDMIVHVGYQICPYSTKILGNNNPHHHQNRRKNNRNEQHFNDDDDPKDDEKETKPTTTTTTNSYTWYNKLTLVQKAILHAIQELSTQHQQKQSTSTSTITTCTNSNSSEYYYSISSSSSSTTIITEETLNRLEQTKVIPKRCEILGDDRTVVLSPDAFQKEEFIQFLLQHTSSSSVVDGKTIDDDDDDDHDSKDNVVEDSCKKDDNNEHNNNNATTKTIDKRKNCDTIEEIHNVVVDDVVDVVWDVFWKSLATIHRSKRIVRRGTVNPESRIRESGYRLIWPTMISDDENDNDSAGGDDDNKPKSNDGIPGSKTSKGWITVTEQGIRQSFDLTKVMFSRGNITEKIRFGKLVMEGDVVLDMYAGIGYYTLPALIKGKAAHVVACEWNTVAVEALRHNVKDNGVQDRVTIVVGDCRIQAKERNLVNMFDRVSLGLLPSSEGGWRTAVRALKIDSGGWLHVHGNVVDAEKDKWVMWLCRKLLSLTNEEGRPNDWTICCQTLERVKSFAPTVSHYVADVYLGPNPRQHGLNVTMNYRCGTCHKGSFLPCMEDIEPPSCALSPNGVLHQEWMMELT